MAKERAERIIKRRREANEKLPLTPDFIDTVVNGALQEIGQQQIHIVVSNPQIRAYFDQAPALLRAQGHRGEPSPARIRAEILSTIASGWHEFADRMFDAGDLRTYSLFEDISSGAMAVAGAIIHADNMVSQSKTLPDEQKVVATQAITNIAGKEDTASSADFYLRLEDLLKRYAELLKQDPEGYLVAQEATRLLATPKEKDPYPVPSVTKFLVGGAELGIRILEELQKLQESRRA